MEIKPLSDINKPKYPLKYEVKEEALKAKLPKRWTQNAAAKAALGALAVVTLAGCSDGQPVNLPTPIGSSVSGTTVTTETPIIDVVYPGETVAPVLNVAPLFIHGEGRGTYGCDMVTSPAYISEAEALTVINEVAQEYGLQFSDEDKAEFSTVLRPVTHFNPPDPGLPSPTIPPDVFITLKTDFSDNKHGVAIEYITVDDVKSWCKDGQAGLIEEYNTQDAAAQMSEALEEARPNGVYTAGVLYDPCEMYLPEEQSAQTDWQALKERSREMATEQLKAQAKDFFEWLKAQGVI